jgi:hypothetical protein
MNTIVSMFNVLDNSSMENKKNTHYRNINTLTSTPALNQGANFKNYQNKIKNNLRKNINYVNSREGFQNSSSSSDNSNSNSNSNQLAGQSNQVLSETSSGTDNSLQKEYSITLLAYQKLLQKVSSGTKDYFNRVSSSNSYLNKLIYWTDPSANGAVMYVTNQGVAKLINDKDVLQSILGINGCPNSKSMVSISLPWDSSYVVQGTTIPTNPTLVVGPIMTTGESCGNEGNNVYVDTLLTDTSATYDGCYADDVSSPVMTFIGGAPQTISGIANGTFSQPAQSDNTYQYITSQTQVPSWNFNGAALINNSSAWGYPTPYPNGNQCACIQNTAYIEQSISLGTGTYTLSFMACGRPSTGANPVDIQLNDTTFFSVTPDNVWTSYSSSFNVTTSGNNTITFIGTNSNGDKSSAFQNISLDTGGVSTASGTYTYDMCKNAAIDGGYKYFALQNVNTDTSMGYCAVSNDYVSSTKNGTSYVVTGGVALWSSNTANSGSSASLTNQGTLSVYNSSGASIFNTDNSSALPSNYLGCYGDASKRAMPYLQSGGQSYDLSACQQKATDNGAAPYFGLQNSTSGTNAQCFLSSSIDGIRDYGKATNCTKISDGSYSGGGYSNAIYSLDASSFYYLILQDDGNIYIYRGSGPNDNQGQIWSSETSGQQQQPNPAYAAANGKYGQNWIASGSTLASGDFVGSTDGSTYLLMQSDGNLVLYTSTNGENCQKMKDGNTGGGAYGNALYELSSVGVPGNMGKVAYVDSNSILYPYPDSSVGLSNDYNSYTNFSSTGNDISDSSFSNATVDSCKSACNDLKNCYGFDFDKTNNVCYPKNNQMYPKGSKTTNSSVDLYVRKPQITNLPTGVSDKIFSTDSLTYDNYTKSNDDIGSSYGLSNANSVEKQQLDQLKSRLDQLSQQLTDSTGSLNSDGIKVENQSTLQTQSIGKYLKEYKNTNNMIKKMSSSGMEGIIRDSDITVLQENYNYYFWSILAVGTVLVTMNVTKQ